mmetsp:Transcript_2643/g.5855  ORF Transcript_2643/g.5855 Transcript_2643/m.5855 type:complete len:212 (-) Transcript_2643:669-1304(-)
MRWRSLSSLPTAAVSLTAVATSASDGLLTAEPGPNSPSTSLSPGGSLLLSLGVPQQRRPAGTGTRPHTGVCRPGRLRRRSSTALRNCCCRRVRRSRRPARSHPRKLQVFHPPPPPPPSSASLLATLPLSRQARCTSTGHRPSPPPEAWRSRTRPTSPPLPSPSTHCRITSRQTRTPGHRSRCTPALVAPPPLLQRPCHCFPWNSRRSTSMC